MTSGGGDQKSPRPTNRNESRGLLLCLYCLASTFTREPYVCRNFRYEKEEDNSELEKQALSVPSPLQSLQKDFPLHGLI